LSVLPASHAMDRRYALSLARTLQRALWIREVDYDTTPLRDSSDGKVYVFSNDEEGAAGGEREEIPTGVLTALTGCYAPLCGREGGGCYAYSCPNKAGVSLGLL
jgi:hypothetical protein